MRLNPFEPSRPTSKVPIPRQSHIRSYGNGRVRRACLECRERKTKCNGHRPCSRCTGMGRNCLYVDGKQETMEKRLLKLEKQAQTYDRLLREIQPRVDDQDRELITRTLAQHSSSGSGHTNSDPPDHRSALAQIRSFGTEYIQEDFHKDKALQAIGFMGGPSEMSWINELYHVLEKDTAFLDSEVSRKSRSLTSVCYFLDDEDLGLDASIDPYGRPPRDIADKLLDCYFFTIHASFPIIAKIPFLQQYAMYYTRPDIQPTKQWLSILNLAFALASKFAQLLSKPYVCKTNSPMIFFTRARKLSFTESQLLEHPNLQRVQVEGLMAFFLMAIGHINRSWRACGISVRSAIALGVNLRSESKETSTLSKEIRYRVWWSIYTLEISARHVPTSIKNMDQYNELIAFGFWDLYQRRICRSCCERRLLCPSDGLPCSTCRAEGQDCIYLPVPHSNTYIPSEEQRMCDFIGQSKDVITQEEDCDPERDPHQSANYTSPSPPGAGRANTASNNSAQANSLTPSEEARILSLGLLYKIVSACIQQDSSFEHRTAYTYLLGLLRKAIPLEPRKIDTVKAVYTMAIIEMATCESFDGIEHSLLHLGAVVAFIRPQNTVVQERSQLALIVYLKFLIISQNLLRMDRVARPISETTTITSDLLKTPEAHSDGLVKIIGALSHLRADIHEEKITNPDEICYKARAIIADLVVWDMEGGKFYGSARSPSMSESILPDCYDDSAFQVMNQYQSAQLSAHWILSTYSTTIFRSDSFCSGIRNSVILFFRLGATRGPEFITRNPGGNILFLWPLVTIATTTTDDGLKDWVKEYLEVIGTKMGVGQSMVLLNMLRSSGMVGPQIK